MRVDFFKPSGKWYATEAVYWTGHYDGAFIHDEFANSLRDHVRDTGRLKGLDAVCLHPYHARPFPLQLKADQWQEE